MSVLKALRNVLVLALVANGVAYSQQQPTPRAERVILSESFGNYVATLDLGKLEVGVQHQFLVEIENPSSSRVSLKHPAVACGCLKVEPLEPEIPPGKTARVLCTLEVPKVSRSETLQQQVRFHEQEGVAKIGELRMILRYSLAGMLHFPTRQAVLQLSSKDGMAQFQIPLLITEPLKVENVSVKVNQANGLRKATVRKTDKGAEVVIVLNQSSISDAGFVGEIHCEDSVTKRSDRIPLIVEQASGLAAFPALITFSKQGDGRYAGNILLRSGEFGSAGQDKLQPWIVNAAVDLVGNEHPLQTESKNLSASACRATISMTEAAVLDLRKQDSPVRITISVKSPNGSGMIAIPCMFKVAPIDAPNLEAGP